MDGDYRHLPPQTDVQRNYHYEAFNRRGTFRRERDAFLLTIKAGCPMFLEDFPMDTQKCPLKFGSFGYTSQDVLYEWNPKRQVAIAHDMKLSQFDLISTPAANRTDNQLKLGNHSVLLVSFHLRRHMGNFLIQVYGPCVLLVVLSWVSFWLNREATADRVSLGITTVLTMTFLGLEARTDLPKVAYPTALDFFIFLSFGFIFATIIQFAFVHYFTKYGSGECYFGADFFSDSESDEEETKSGNRGRRRTLEDHQVPDFPPEVIRLEVGILSSGLDQGRTSSRPAWSSWTWFPCLSPNPSPPQSSTSTSPATTRNLGAQPTSSSMLEAAGASSNLARRLSLLSSQRSKSRGPGRRKMRTPRLNSVSKIDRVSRVLFPLLFLSFNVVYWSVYLSRSQRISSRWPGADHL